MKRILQRCLAALLIVGLLAGFSTAFAADPEPVDVALGATVTATDSIDGGGLYSPSDLVDGLLGNYPTEQKLGWSTGAAASATIKLDKSYDLNKIELCPVTYETGKFFPSAYTVSISTDGKTWTKVGGAENVGDVGTAAQTVSFDAAAAAYIKIDVTPRSVLEKDGITTSVYAQVSEVRAYGTATAGQETVPVNVAKGKTVTATSSVDGAGLYAPAYLVDGLYGNYPTDGHLGWCTGEAASATIQLGDSCKISRVVLYPVTFEAGKFFPSAYTVSVSTDGENWTSVGSATDVGAVGTTAQEIKFNETTASFVKIDMTPRSVLEKDGVTTSVYAQISEAEVYGSVLPKVETPTNIAPG
jgi:hypothetical protein